MSQLPVKELVLMPVHSVNLKNVLCQIKANTINIHDGLLLLGDWGLALPVWHNDAVERGGVHPFALLTMKVYRVVWFK